MLVFLTYICKENKLKTNILCIFLNHAKNPFDTGINKHSLLKLSSDILCYKIRKFRKFILIPFTCPKNSVILSNIKNLTYS